jgi:hypothetical protein
MSSKKKGKYDDFKRKIKKEDAELFSIDAYETQAARYDSDWVSRQLARSADVSTGSLYKVEQLTAHSESEITDLLEGRTDTKKALTIESAYRALKSSELAQRIEETIKNLTKEDLTSRYRLHHTDCLESYLPRASVDTIITHARNTKDISVVSSAASHALKDTGFCVVLLNQALVPICQEKFSSYSMYYVWMLSYRLPIIDLIGRRMWSEADFHYWIPALIFSKKDPYVELDLDLKKDIISPPKPHKNLFKYGLDLELFVDIIKNITPAEGVVCDPLCGEASFFAAVAENRPFIGGVPDEETFKSINKLIEEAQNPPVENNEDKAEEEIKKAEKEYRIALQKYNVAHQVLSNARTAVFNLEESKEPKDPEKENEVRERLQEAVDNYRQKYREMFQKRQHSLSLIYARGNYDAPRRAKCEMCEGIFFTYSYSEKACGYSCKLQYVKKQRKLRRLQKLEGRTCPGCQKRFCAKRMNMLFCSSACRQKNYRTKRKGKPVTD